MDELVKQLTSIVGPSGYEFKVASFLAKEMAAKANNLWRDPLGNLIVQVKELKDGPRVMVLAHMDEICLFVRKIEESGFLRLERSAGITEKDLVAAEVIVLTETGEEVKGVIGTKSHHLMNEQERLAALPASQTYVDVGAESKKDISKLGIKVGNPVVYGRRCFRVGNKVFANSLDNRAGLAVLVKLLTELEVDRLQCTLYLVGSVQEEFSLRGVLPVVRSVKPDLIICVDAAIACDTPELEGYVDVALGKGPTVNLYTFHGKGTAAGLIPSRSLLKRVLEIAETEDITIQRNVVVGLLTDASFAQLELEGIPALDLGFPQRYMHSPLQVCDLRDLERLKDLLMALLYRVDKNFLGAANQA